MVLDTGYRCPEIQSFGFFPFAIAYDPIELLNQSGWSGPIPKLDRNRSGFSGVLGDGTFYPKRANLDALNRLFWCVKDYNITINVAKQSFAGQVTCEADLGFPGLLPIQAATYCGIGIYQGDNSLAIGQLNTKTLTVQDYCSFYSPTGTFNANRPGYCPTELYSGTNPNTQICVPVNPIQKFNDLLCRKSYFTWAPKQEEWDHFNTGNYSAINSPYLMSWHQFRVTEPAMSPPYHCGLSTDFVEKVAGMFTLSIMDTDGLAYSGNSLRFASRDYVPPVNESVYPFDCQGKSGETLTNSWGEITGYGINPKPSGLYTPPLFDAGTGNPSYPLTDNKGQYFPFIHFQLRLRNKVNIASNACPVNDLITSIMPRSGSAVIGTLAIQDFISGSSSLEADAATTILEIPLYSTSSMNSSQLQVQVKLRPGSSWNNLRGQSLY